MSYSKQDLALHPEVCPLESQGVLSVYYFLRSEGDSQSCSMCGEDYAQQTVHGQDTLQFPWWLQRSSRSPLFWVSERGMGSF